MSVRLVTPARVVLENVCRYVSLLSRVALPMSTHNCWKTLPNKTQKEVNTLIGEDKRNFGSLFGEHVQRREWIRAQG